MAFLTTNGTMELAIAGMTTFTGSIFLSLLMIVLIIVAIGLAFPLPMEWTAIFIMPLLLTLMAYDASFYPAGGVFLLYMAFIIAYNFLRR